MASKKDLEAIVDATWDLLYGQDYGTDRIKAAFEAAGYGVPEMEYLYIDKRGEFTEDPYWEDIPQ